MPAFTDVPWPWSGMNGSTARFAPAFGCALGSVSFIVQVSLPFAGGPGSDLTSVKVSALFAPVTLIPAWYVIARGSLEQSMTSPASGELELLPQAASRTGRIKAR